MECTHCNAELEQTDSWGNRAYISYGDQSGKRGDIFRCPSAEGFETQAWFDYNVQKMVSIAASMATAKFNQLRTMRDCEENTTCVGNDPDRLIDAEGYMWHEEIEDVPLAFF